MGNCVNGLRLVMERMSTLVSSSSVKGLTVGGAESLTAKVSYFSPEKGC